MQKNTKKKRSRQRKFSVCPDQFLHSVWELMFDDLNSSVPMKREWFGVHTYAGPSYEGAGPYTFKVLYQLSNFFKRCIMKEDRKFDELASECLSAFERDQSSYCLPKPQSWYSEKVLLRANQIVHLVLGEFDFAKLSRSATFGKKAARGLPLRKSYLDNRVKTLTGTSVQWEWFKACLNDDIHLNRAIRTSFKEFEEVMDIDVVPVPKSFKAARIIAPDTVLGGFLSRGLGDYVREELERWTHIDLASQQARHRQEAQKASKDGKRATIDMSKASDSFTMEHVHALLPESWWSVIEAVRTPVGVIDREEVTAKAVPLRSVMLMGSGHTFPLQTLLFYSLAKAVVELSGSRAKVDVYGDDIMLPSIFAPRFYRVMHELGFTINVDKSFHEGHFRESCGGDYLAGLDVRPFMPEYETNTITQKNEYASLVFKVYNGLLERWSLHELPRTFGFIVTHLLAHRIKPAVVPYHEPPDSGLYSILPELEDCVSMPKVNPITCMLEYKKLVARSKKRKPRTERIYYWYSLRPQGMINAYDGEVPPGCLDEAGCEPKKGGSTEHRWVEVA